MEQWKDIKDYIGLYQVSNKGRVRSLERVVKARGGSLRIIPGKELTPSKNNKGYLIVNLSKDGKQKPYLVHRLVANAFIKNDNPKIKKEVNHIDFNKANNCVENLEWCTKEYNIQYGGSNRPGPDGRKVRCINNGMIFNSIKEASEYAGLKNPTTIRNCCIGKSKSSGIINGKPGRWEFL